MPLLTFNFLFLKVASRQANGIENIACSNKKKFCSFFLCIIFIQTSRIGNVRSPSHSLNKPEINRNRKLKLGEAQCLPKPHRTNAEQTERAESANIETSNLKRTSTAWRVLMFHLRWGEHEYIRQCSIVFAALIQECDPENWCKHLGRKLSWTFPIRYAAKHDKTGELSIPFPILWTSKTTPSDKQYVSPKPSTKRRLPPQRQKRRTARVLYAGEVLPGLLGRKYEQIMCPRGRAWSTLRATKNGGNKINQNTTQNASCLRLHSLPYLSRANFWLPMQKSHQPVGNAEALIVIRNDFC